MNSISIIIPCYPPHFKFLDRIINNILKQTYLPKEIILCLSECNNQKKDEIVKQFNNLSLEFYIYNTIEKQTPAQNRNRGLKKAKGDYIMFLDSDDIYHLQKIELTLKIINLKNPNLILHGFTKNKEDINKIYDFDKVDIITEFLLKLKNDVIMKKFDKEYFIKMNQEIKNPENPQFFSLVVSEIFNNDMNHMLKVINQPEFPTEEILQKTSKIKEKMFNIPVIDINNKIPIANGIITVKNGLEIEFINMVGEDSIFISEVLIKFGKFCYMDIPLIYHIPGNGAKNYEIINESSLKL